MFKLFFLPILFLFSCQSGTTQQDTSISELLNTTDFLAQIDLLENEQLIDLRTPEEVNDGFIPNALFINFHDKNTFNSKIEALDKNKPIMIYCASGNRSGKAAKILKKNEFTHIIDLKGGFTAWEKAELPIDFP